MAKTRLKPYAQDYDNAYAEAEYVERDAKAGRCGSAIASYGEVMMNIGSYWTKAKGKDPDYHDRSENLSELEDDTRDKVLKHCVASSKFAGLGRSGAKRKKSRRSRR